MALAGGDDLAGAARVAGIGAGWRDRIGVVSRLDARARPLAAALARCRDELGDAAFEAAFEEGRRLAADEAVAFLRRTRGERRRPNHGWDSLTPTELQVVELVRQGLTNRAIADQLLMGAETVKTHLSHMFAKLGVRNRAPRLAALATERGALGRHLGGGASPGHRPGADGHQPQARQPDGRRARLTVATIPSLDPDHRRGDRHVPPRWPSTRTSARAAGPARPGRVAQLARRCAAT